METSQIPFEQLHLSKLNTRYGKKHPDVSDILSSVREKGILLPLIVRREAGGFGVVAGGRRFRCGEIIREETGHFDPPRCLIMAEGDDAEALEISLLENVARRDPDPLSEFETFARLLKAGRTVEGIASTFGVTAQTVKQRLALANLLPQIKQAYRAGEIDDETLQHLTLATKSQQKDWLRLFEDEEGNAPTGRTLKHWLFGGASISTKAALFALEDYTGEIVNDLFGDERYFASAEAFWQAQNVAIEAKAQGYRNAGWSEVIVLEVGAYFSSWDHQKTAKRKGGKVYVECAHSGQITFHEGYLTKRQAAKAARADARKDQDTQDIGAKSASSGKPQMTHAMENYLQLHRHAIVRLALLRDPNCALRLMVAHALAPTGNWNVRPDPQRAHSNDIAASVAKSAAQAAFETERNAVEALLGTAKEGGTLRLFAHLLTLTDEDVLRLAAFVMADSLAMGHETVEAAGLHLKASAADLWQPDERFLELVRDRETIHAMLEEVAGKSVAQSNTDQTVKAQRKIIRDCLAGQNWRSKVDGWLPGWMQFPFKPYGTGPSALAEAAKAAAEALHI